MILPCHGKPRKIILLVLKVNSDLCLPYFTVTKSWYGNYMSMNIVKLIMTRTSVEI